MLEKVFTEWYVKPWSLERAIGLITPHLNKKLGQRMNERHRDGLDTRFVEHSPLITLRQRLSQKKFASMEDYYRWCSRETGKWILRKGFGNANALYGFIRNVDPSVFAACRKLGIQTLGDQMIAPAVVERDENRRQMDRWPGWEREDAANMDVMIDLEKASWDNLDHITCGSEYVKDGLISQGVPPESITILPYAPSGADLPLVERQLRTGPVRVGFVGSVNLRKGTPYFFQVAKRFDPAKVQFTMVGPVSLIPEVAERERGAVELVGAVPRGQVEKHLSRFDIYFFPSTCEGCAGSVLEAMDTGLPIISTPNSGTIIREGIEGHLCAYDDIDGFERHIRRIAENPDLRLTMGLASRQRVESFSLKWYCNALGDLFRSMVEHRSATPRVSA
jgi:glycosyltransferase involved in cell wall biosynthesis